MKAKTFPSGIYIGVHRGIKLYAEKGKIQCLFGWLPKTFDSLHQAKWHICRWSKQS